MNPIVEDLDILRPKPKMVRIGGKEIDVSFVPCGITFEVDRIINALSTIKEEEIRGDEKIAKKAFDLSVELCVVYCSRKHPEMTREWFEDNTSFKQLGGFTSAIRMALIDAYNVGSGESKNEEPAKEETPE